MALAAIAIGGGSVAVAAGIAAAWEPGIVLGPAGWVAWTVGSTASVAGFLVAVACGVGPLGALVRWRRTGAWTGLQAIGVGGRHLLGLALLWGLVGAAGTLACTHLVEPAAHRALADLAEEPWERIALWPGRAVRLGDLTVRPAEVVDGVARDVLLVEGEWVGSARRLRWSPRGVVLERGTLVGAADRPWRLSWERWHRALPPGERRIELVERGTRDLADRARRTRAAGGDPAYEWAVYWKRWTHPLAALLLPLALLPLGAGRHPWAAAGAGGLGWLLALRVGDHLAPVLGGGASALAGPLWLAGLALVTWARWRER